MVDLQGNIRMREKRGERPFGLVPIDRETRNVRFLLILWNVFLGSFHFGPLLFPFCFKMKKKMGIKRHVFGATQQIQQLFFSRKIKRTWLAEWLTGRQIGGNEKLVVERKFQLKREKIKSKKESNRLLLLVVKLWRIWHLGLSLATGRSLCTCRLFFEVASVTAKWVNN